MCPSITRQKLHKHTSAQLVSTIPELDTCTGTSSSSTSRPSLDAEDWPSRCPPEILQAQLPRLKSITAAQAQELLCAGQAFVAPAEGLLGRQLLMWDWQYLSLHLPASEQYGVMLDEGSKKIVMSHSARNGERMIEGSTAVTKGADKNGGGNQTMNFSDQTRMSFQDFVTDARKYTQTGEGQMPYFGLHVLWRHKETDNGFLGKIDQDMAQDVWSVNFNLMKEWQEANQLPLVQRFYLFAGIGGTLYHCHYDLQPNLHVQLTGRKRFIIFPPEDWRYLYPFPVHHDLDRRSQVDLDNPDDEKFPQWRGAHGTVVELEPGDAIYIPPYWWHHVQSITPETTSMAIWFFERYPQSASVMYGISSAAEELSLMRDVEEFIGKHFDDVTGEEDASRPRPVKAAQVANFMRWLKGKLGMVAGHVDGELLCQSMLPPECLQTRIINMMKECDGIDTEELARKKLKSFLIGRF